MHRNLEEKTDSFFSNKIKVKNLPAVNPIKIRPTTNNSNDVMFLLMTIKTDPIIAGILFRSKPVFLTINNSFCLSMLD